jgi:exodeoxyribonuclease VII large subunit
VQGPDAPLALCEAIARAGRRSEVDALIVCRGGGALEDLWAFNDERVVRAIRASPLPVVCGVGHETDVTLADLAADVRAPTPTAAAELAAPERKACLEALGSRQARLQRGLQDALDVRSQRLDRAARRLARPGEVLRRQNQGLELLAHRLIEASRRRFEDGARRADQIEGRLRRDVGVVLSRHGARLGAVSGRLLALDPTRVLARGYALLTDAGRRAVTSVAEVSRGAALVAHLADGRLAVTVESVERSSTPPDA